MLPDFPEITRLPRYYPTSPIYPKYPRYYPTSPIYPKYPRCYPTYPSIPDVTRLPRYYPTSLIYSDIPRLTQVSPMLPDCPNYSRPTLSLSSSPKIFNLHDVTQLTQISLIQKYTHTHIYTTYQLFIVSTVSNLTKITYFMQTFYFFNLSKISQPIMDYQFSYSLGVTIINM